MTPHKLSPWSTPLISLGYPISHHGYYFIDLSTYKLHVSRHVTFDGNVFPFSKVDNVPSSLKFLGENIPCPYLSEHLMSMTVQVLSPLHQPMDLPKKKVPDPPPASRPLLVYSCVPEQPTNRQPPPPPSHQYLMITRSGPNQYNLHITSLFPCLAPILVPI